MAESGGAITSLLAWWGALVSTGLGAVRVIEFLRDRPKVVVSYKTGWRVTPNLSGYDPRKDYTAVTVTNKGRRPVTITKVGAVARRKGDQHFVLSDSFIQGPRELTEGKATQYLFDEDGLDPGRFKWFLAFDMTGRSYRCKIRPRDR